MSEICRDQLNESTLHPKVALFSLVIYLDNLYWRARFFFQSLFMTTCSWCGNLSGLRGIAHQNTLFFLSPSLCFSFTGNTQWPGLWVKVRLKMIRAVLNFGFALHLPFLEWRSTICYVCTVLTSHLTPLLNTFLEFLVILVSSKWD